MITDPMLLVVWHCIPGLQKNSKYEKQVSEKLLKNVQYTSNCPQETFHKELHTKSMHQNISCEY